MSLLVNCVSHAQRDAADKLGLKRVPPVGSSEDLFSIYDGSRFVFRQSPWSIITLWRMVQRYWLTYFTFTAPKQMLQKFLCLYDLQRQGVTFDSPEAFLSKLELYDLTQQSMHDYLKVTKGGMCCSTCLAAELCMMPAATPVCMLSMDHVSPPTPHSLPRVHLVTHQHSLCASEVQIHDEHFCT